MKKLVLWFTGLSGSGKTTIAIALQKELERTGKKVEILDGDAIRSTVHSNLGFTREDIRTNNRLIAELAEKSSADVVLVPIISPYSEDRATAKCLIKKRFIELFVKCPLDRCITRDVKGLYGKALKGEINNFIGISKSNPYEPPKSPDIEVNTTEQTIEETTNQIISFLKNKI